MFSKGQTEALGVLFRSPSVVPVYLRTINHHPDLHMLNHQYCEMLTIPKLGILVESLEIIRTSGSNNQVLCHWKMGTMIKRHNLFFRGQ